MTTHIDLRILPSNIPSLCIPRVFPNIDEKRIRHIFDDLGLGEIQEIDFVSKKTEKGENFNRIFVHFRRWFSNKNADTARERLLDGKEIKIIYDEPWFWKVSAYRPPAQAAPRPVPKPAARPHIEFDTEEERHHQQERPPRPHQQERPHQERPPRYQERPPRPRQEIKKVSNTYEDDFGRDRNLRKDVTARPAIAPAVAIKVQPANVTTNFVAIPRQVMAKRRIINKKPPLKVEEEDETPEAVAINLEDGEVEE